MYLTFDLWWMFEYFIFLWSLIRSLCPAGVLVPKRHFQTVSIKLQGLQKKNNFWYTPYLCLRNSSSVRKNPRTLKTCAICWRNVKTWSDHKMKEIIIDKSSWNAPRGVAERARNARVAPWLSAQLWATPRYNDRCLFTRGM